MDHSVKPHADLFVMSRTKSVIRYWTTEVKGLATSHDEIEEMIRSKTDSCYKDFMYQLSTRKEFVSAIADIVSTYDCLQSLGKFALSFGSCKCLPKFESSGSAYLAIRSMRHPLFAADPKFITNDIEMSRENNSHCMVLTGPNMAGKSTLMKQVCLLAILAQSGSFVPAESYEASVFTNIKTRIGTLALHNNGGLGAQDNILKGSSTFMIELDEMNSILEATKKEGVGLFIVDEFGRGTSTHDG